jgi:hypothetical protein
MVPRHGAQRHHHPLDCSVNMLKAFGSFELGAKIYKKKKLFKKREKYVGGHACSPFFLLVFGRYLY